MSIHRIGETQAKPETTEAMRDVLISILPLARRFIQICPLA